MSKRYRYGEVNSVQVARLTGFAVQVDDLCYFEAGTLSDARQDAPNGSAGILKSAASYPWAGTLPATQLAFAAAFAGVSGQRWPVTGNNPPVFGGQDGYIRVSVNGVFEFDCAPGSTFVQFQPVGPDASGNYLLPQQVIAVSGNTYAIGLVEKAAVNASKVLIRVFSGQMIPLTN